MSEWRRPDVEPLTNPSRMSLAMNYDDYSKPVKDDPVKVVQPITNCILDKDYSKQLRNIVKTVGEKFQVLTRCGVFCWDLPKIFNHNNSQATDLMLASGIREEKFCMEPLQVKMPVNVTTSRWFSIFFVR